MKGLKVKHALSSLSLEIGHSVLRHAVDPLAGEGWLDIGY